MSRLIDKESLRKDSKPLKIVVAGLSRTGTACMFLFYLFFFFLYSIKMKLY